MKTLKFVLLIVCLLAGPAAGADAPREITITWYGHACFVVTTAEGIEILIDPIDMGDYQVPDTVEPDVVTVSHNHFDHDRVDSVLGDPLVLYGKEQDGADPDQQVLPIDTEVQGVRIYTVASHHFPADAERFTLNAIFVFEFDGLRLAHLGDLGRTLTAEQLAQIGEIDILMIPVGGKYTISGDDAHAVVAQLKPSRLVIPMHFRTYVADFLPETADDFVQGNSPVKRVDGHEYVLAADDQTAVATYVVFDTFKREGFE